MSPRPGFVLEVDRSTPSTLFWHGEGFRLERLPTGSRVIYAPEPVEPLDDPVASIRDALVHPLGDAEPLPALLRPGMKLTIAFDDVSLPLPPMRRPDSRQLVIEQVLDLAAEAGVDDVVLVGMPGRVSIDLAPLWHREVALVGAYAYGCERTGGTLRRTFAIAMEVVAAARLGRLVTARYPLERFEEAVAHAGAAGRRGATKIVFEMHPRSSSSRSPKGPAS